VLKFRLTQDKKFIELVEFNLNSERNDLFKFFKRKSKKAAFNVLVDRGIWDGYDSFITKEAKIAIGLWKEIYNFSSTHGYDCEIEGIDDLLNLTINRESYLKWSFYNT